MKTLEIYCDGSSSGDAKLMGVGIVFVYNNKVLKHYSYKIPFEGESFIAEYIAVIYALFMIDFYVENIYVYTDNPPIISSYMGIKPDNNIAKKLAELLRERVDNLKCKHFRIRYCKSHSTNVFHNLADKLALEGRNKSF